MLDGKLGDVIETNKKWYLEIEGFKIYCKVQIRSLVLRRLHYSLSGGQLIWASYNRPQSSCVQQCVGVNVGQNTRHEFVSYKSHLNKYMTTS